MQRDNNNISIAFIGSGNVATKLAISLFQKGVNITEVCSRNMLNSTKLAKLVKAEPIDNISKISNNIDFVIISISDNALKSIDLSELPKQALICHTSGSVDMGILNLHDNYGIFYPLQTFSKDAELDISEVPFCIEANNEENTERLISLAQLLSNNVSRVNSLERAKMHLAAVFTCNFTNAMYSIAEDLMKESGLSFDYLRPLIKETANKALHHSPKKIQTGPAVRNDRNIIDKHILDLQNKEDYANIYNTMSELIYKMNK